jgi:hypothetical protein
MPGGRSEVWTPRDRGWGELLDRLPHDIFHRPEYHLLSGLGHQGSPYLFSYREDDGGLFLWPYLMRPIAGTEYSDVSSVYGYAGPLATGGEEFARRAWQALLDSWRLQGVVSAFTRFHPLIGNAELFSNMRCESAAEGLISEGSTVSIDLTLPSAEQVRRYQKVLRQEIRKSRALGFVTSEDVDWTEVAGFVRVYRETMARRNSRDEYLVDEAWVEEFRRSLGTKARLFVTRWDGEVAAALIAIEYRPFLHAHLTGINSDMASHSPLKVLLDDVREWGAQRSLRSFHLGGGLGGREDSLFQFKRRFSPVTHVFQTGRWIVDPFQYEELKCAHRENLLRSGYRIGNPQYFPAYRYQPVEADAQPVPLADEELIAPVGQV